MPSPKQQTRLHNAQGSTPCQMPPCQMPQSAQQALSHTSKALPSMSIQQAPLRTSEALPRKQHAILHTEQALPLKHRTPPALRQLLRRAWDLASGGTRAPLLCALLALPLLAPKRTAADGLFGLVGVPSVDIEGYGWLGDLYLEHTLKVLSTSEDQPEPQINAVFVEDSLWIISGQLQQQGYLYPAIGVRLSDAEGNMLYEGKWAGQELTPYLPPSTEAAHVLFSIEPGLRFYFESIRIEGLPADLTSNPASFFYPTDQLFSFKSTRFYNRSRGISGVQGIVSRLRAMGYRDADVVDQKVDIDKATGAVHFSAKIEHGPVYYADELVIEPGSLALATKVLSGMPLFLHMDDPTRLTPEWLQDNIQQVRNRYYQHGYPEVRIIVRYEDVSAPRSTEVSVSTAIDPVDAVTTAEPQATDAETTQTTAATTAAEQTSPTADAEQTATSSTAAAPSSTAAPTTASSPVAPAVSTSSPAAPAAPVSALEAAAAPVGIHGNTAFDSNAIATALLAADINALQPAQAGNTLQPVTATAPTAATASDIAAAAQQSPLTQHSQTVSQPTAAPTAAAQTATAQTAAASTPTPSATAASEPATATPPTATGSRTVNGASGATTNGNGGAPYNGTATPDTRTATTTANDGTTATNGSGTTPAAANGGAAARTIAQTDAIVRPSALADGTAPEAIAAALAQPSGARYQRVIIQVQSGPQVNIGKISFSGEYGTNMSVLENQLTVAPGEELDRNRVENTRNKLSSLGIFRSVEIEYVEVDENTWDVIYNMQMKQRTEISLIAGVGTFDIIRGGFLIEQNNLWGLAHNQRLRAVQSFKATDVTYRYGIPQVFGNDVDFYAKGSYLYRQEISFNRQEYGAATGFQHYYRPLRTTFDIQYSLEQLSARNRNFLVAPGPTQATVSAITLKASHNGVDNPIFPTKGWQARASAEFAIPDIGGQVNYQRLEMGVAYHTPLNESGLIFHTNLRHGVVVTPGTAQQDIPVNRRFFMGGENTVRGYRRDQASPLDSAGNQIGAVSYILWQVELEQKLTEDLSFVTFLDAIGNAADISQYPFNETLASVGLGLNYRTFVGPLRLEYGYNVKKRPGDPDGTLQISIGFPF